MIRLVLLLFGLGAAVSATVDSVDDYVRQAMEDQQIPGLSLLIVESGKVTKAKGYGLANLEHDIPVTPDTLFQSGSIGKQFTAAEILLLVEDGKLTLNDVLPLHFPQAPSSWHRITVRHLLTHTSGIMDYGPDEVGYQKGFTEEELLHIMSGLPVEFEPGTQWSYSNSGYVILGILISQVTGSHWSEFVVERILRPAGMRTARPISDGDIVFNRGAGYERSADGELRNQEWISETLHRTGDGNLYFTARDLAAWDAVLRERKLFSKESYEAWWSPVRLRGGSTFPYGFAWLIDEQRGHRLLQHGGSWQGFKSFLARYVDDDVTVWPC